MIRSSVIANSVLTLLFVLSVCDYSAQLKFMFPPSYHHPSQCPLWFYHNSLTNSCECLPYQPLFSCKGRKAYSKTGYLVTVHQNQSLVSASFSKSHILLYNGTNVSKRGYRLLPDNLSDLNHLMCGPLNRKGYLCSDCIDGFGPSMSIIEHPNDCYRCRDNWHGVILYLIIVLVPVTLLYLVILVFQIRMTSAPIPCFVMYSQLVCIVLSHPWETGYHKITMLMFTETGDL